jgi:hypothetical protein
MIGNDFSKLYYAVSLIFCSIFLISFDAPKQNIIVWNSDYLLKWEDFKGKPQESKYSAAANVGVDTEFSYQNLQLKLKIQAVFDKKLSWVKKKDKNDLILSHEQGHFDIAEIFARRLKIEILNADLNEKNFQKQLSSLINKNTTELGKQQKLYDKETNHHINKIEQKKWDDWIKEELQKTEKFKEAEMVINF